MANVSSNPWSVTSSDVVTSIPSAAPNGLVLNTNGTVTLTTGAAHNLSVQDGASVVSATNSAYNGYYVVMVVSSATVAILAPQFSIPSGTAASGGGTAAKVLYKSQVRIEDISWQAPTAAGNQIDLRDRAGNIIWQATASGAGSQNRGKIFWVNGLTPLQVDSGIIIITVN